MFRKSFSSLLLGAMVSIGVIFSSSFSYTKNSSINLKNNSLATREAARLVLNDQEHVELEKSEMTSYIVASTSTPTATEVTVQFTSVDLVAYGNSARTIYMVIDDANFAGMEAENPYIEPSEDPFNGYIAVIKNVKNNKNIIIPETFQYGTEGFLVKNAYIQTGALDLDEEVGEGTQYIETITIPSYIERIDSDAFVNIGDKVTFQCQATEKPEGWADDWTDGTNIVWGAEVNPTAKQRNAVFGVNELVLARGGQYIAGYDNRKDEETGEVPFPKYEEAYYPLIAKYNTIKDGVAIPHTEELPLIANDNRNLPYDGVGKIGSPTIAIKFDVLTEDGETIDYESFSFDNIYVAKRHEELNTYTCDTSIVYSINSLKRFSKTISILDIIQYRFSKIATFCGYTLFEMSFDLTQPDFYSEEHSDVTNNYKAELSSKKYRIRYAFYRLSSASVLLTYKSGDELIEVQLPVKTPLSTREISSAKGNKFSFILQNNTIGNGFSVNKIVSFQFINLVLDMHLWNNDSSVKVGRTEFSYSFGLVDIYNSKHDKMNHQDLDTFMILFFIAYTLIYAATTIALFFYLKNKYKNDEFRRMKPKQYIKKAVIGFIGLGIILLAVLSIIYRFGVFANTISAFNPADVFVIFVGIVALIFFGYFIKYFVGVIKARKARNLALKLKLNNDVVDDGTK